MMALAHQFQEDPDDLSLIARKKGKTGIGIFAMCLTSDPKGHVLLSPRLSVAADSQDTFDRALNLPKSRVRDEKPLRDCEQRL